MAERPPRFRVALLALVGAASIGAGVFGPALRVDSLLYDETLRYWDLAGVEKLGVLVAAALALPGVYRRRHGWIVLSVLGLWAAIAYPWVRSWITPERDGFLTRVGTALRRPLEDMATQIVLEYDMVHPQWGAAALLGGVAALTLAGWMALR